MAGVVTALGWSWDQTEEQLDIPRLIALNQSWEVLPPIPMQLARISLFLGMPPATVHERTPTSTEVSAELDVALAAGPTLTRTKILTPEDFLGAKHG